MLTWLAQAHPAWLSCRCLEVLTLTPIHRRLLAVLRLTARRLGIFHTARMVWYQYETRFALFVWHGIYYREKIQTSFATYSLKIRKVLGRIVLKRFLTSRMIVSPIIIRNAEGFGGKQVVVGALWRNCYCFRFGRFRFVISYILPLSPDRYISAPIS